MAERIRVPNSSSGASAQQRVGLYPSCDTCVPEQDTTIIASLHPGVNGYL